MPSARQTRNAGLVVSLFAALSAAGLLVRQRAERVKRGSDLSTPDARHFRRQDRRRTCGGMLMLALAAAVAVGSRLPHITAGRSNPAFLGTWLAISVLILVLLALAFIDLWATRAYARRHHQALMRERRRIFRQETHGRFQAPGGWNEAHPPGNGFPH